LDDLFRKFNDLFGAWAVRPLKPIAMLVSILPMKLTQSSSLLAGSLLLDRLVLQIPQGSEIVPQLGFEGPASYNVLDVLELVRLPTVQQRGLERAFRGKQSTSCGPIAGSLPLGHVEQSPSLFGSPSGHVEECLHRIPSTHTDNLPHSPGSLLIPERSSLEALDGNDPDASRTTILLSLMLWTLYQILTASALVLVAPFLLVLRGRHYLQTLPGRLGRYGGEPHGEPPTPRRALWIHAVSVGEVAVAVTLIRALPESLPILVTTVTPTGQKRARAALASRGVTVAYLPFDLGFAVRRFFTRFDPAALVLVEGDYWPLVLSYARRRGMEVAVVNGRVSGRSFARLRRIRRWTGPLFYDAVGRFGVQTGEDRQRLVDLGVDDDRVLVTGNLKYDSPEPPELPELTAVIRGLAAGRPIVVAGSTMKDEDEIVLDAFAASGGGERTLLILVPRHPERWDAVARLVKERSHRLLRRSTLDVTADVADEGVDVVLLDSLGELAGLYRLATIAVIGGTLVPTGGHNPLEPARFAVPIVVGESMENFQEMADKFNQADAWRQVRGATGLAAAWDAWLSDADEAAAVGLRGAELLAANRGALERTVRMLATLVHTIDTAAVNTAAVSTAAVNTTEDREP
jgi:3-deoxy-D-manno-octulosonic-acid transferase